MSASRQSNGLISGLRRAAHHTRRVAGAVQSARSGYKSKRTASGSRRSAARAGYTSEAREQRDEIARQKREAREQATREKRERKEREQSARREATERARAEAAHRRRLLQEQSHRKREQKIATQEREEMIAARRPPRPRRRSTLNLSSLDEAKEMFGDYETNGKRARNPSPLFCADCDKEFHTGDMRHTMRDGRTICSKCQKAAKTKAARKAQPALFGEMEGSQNVLFNPSSCRCKNKRKHNPSCDAGAYEVKEYSVKGHCRARRATGGAAKTAQPTHKAKSTSKRRTKAVRATKKRTGKQPYEELTLSQFVRRLGGIRPARDGEDAGELRRLSNKESMTSGLVSKNATHTLERMMDAANAEGYRDPYDNSEFELGSFADAVGDDAAGYVKISHPGKEYDYRQRNPRPGYAHCYECDAQKPVDALIQLPDGRVVCADCVRISQAVAARKAAKPAASSSSARRHANPEALLITPKLARELLGTQKNNRAVDTERVAAIAKIMRAGGYHDKTGLVIDGGVLRDGQHRLLAVIKSNQPVTFHVRRTNGLETLGRLAMLPGGILAGMDLHRRLTGTAKQKRAAKRSAKARRQRHRTNPAEDKPIQVPANVRKILKEFLDKDPTEYSEYLTPPGTPKDVSILGALIEIHLVDGSVLKFDTNKAMLGARGGDIRRRMYIGLEKKYAQPADYTKGKEHDCGEVWAVDYLAFKPHLKYRKEHAFRHKLGEEGGRKPHLIFIDGLLKFRGGDYKIKTEGIRD